MAFSLELLITEGARDGYAVYPWAGNRERSMRFGPHGYARALRGLSEAVTEALALDLINPTTGEGEAPDLPSAILTAIQSAIDADKDALVRFDPSTKRYGVKPMTVKEASSARMRRLATEVADYDPALAFDLVNAANGPIEARVALLHRVARSYGDYDESRTAGEKGRKIPESEAKAWKTELRRHKGKKGPGGLTFGQKYKHKGKDWLVYDFDADSTAPGGSTLVLVTPDYTETLRWVKMKSASTLFRTARSYGDYVDEKKRKNEKPMAKDEWEARQNGGKKEEPKKPEGKPKEEPKKDEAAPKADNPVAAYKLMKTDLGAAEKAFSALIDKSDFDQKEGLKKELKEAFDTLKSSAAAADKGKYYDKDTKGHAENHVLRLLGRLDKAMSKEAAIGFDAAIATVL